MFDIQFEGAVNEGNKGDSIWDTFTRKPGKQFNICKEMLSFNIELFLFFCMCQIGKIMDFSNADTAVDQYHRFEVNYRQIYRQIYDDQFKF